MPVLRRALSGEPATLDPGAAADTFSTSVLLDLYEGLTSETPAGDIVPGAAENWTIDPSGREYTFEIRHGARWSNGIPLKAADFVASWRREVNPRLGSPAADDLRLVAHAAAIIAGKEPPTALAVFAKSDSTLVVELERPAPYFPQILSHPSTFPVFSEATAKTHKPTEWVSNGPYTLGNWLPATGMTLIANAEYWDKQKVSIKMVHYQFAMDDSSQYAQYRSGELDLTDTVPANALPAIRQERPHELAISPFLATCYYGLNLASTALTSPALRQALAMAINRPKLVESLGFGQIAAYGYVSPGTANYTLQPWSWKTDTDVDRIATARKLYARAGYSIEHPLHLRLLFNNNEVIRHTAVLTAAMWREVLGIEVELVGEEYKVFLESRHDTARWEVARLAWNADFNDASNFLDVLRTHSPNNDMSYGNQAVDAELDEAAVARDMDTRRGHLERAERLILDDYPIIPLYYFVSKRLVKPGLRGVEGNPLNHVASKNLSFDP